MAKKCNHTHQNKLYSQARWLYKRNTSAGRFYTSSSTSAVISLISVLCLSFAGASLFATHDTYATASTLSLSIDNTTVGLDISSISSTGTFAKSSSSTISASTNNATGYTLSIAGNSSSDYNKLINNDDTNAKLNSITEATTESQFSALSGTAYNNMWGYLPSKHCTNATDINTCTTNTDFLPAPSASGDILDVTSTPNTNNTPNEYQLAIGARVDSTTKIGAYTNTFNVILVGNAIPYTITYIDNVVSNMPVDVNSTSQSTTINISSDTPQRAGYTFLGWCDTIPTTTNNTDSCSTTTYQPNDIYTLDQTGASNNLTLYAMWDKTSITNINQLTYMQDFASLTSAELARVKSSMATNTNYQLTDIRDGNKYWITKLQTANSNPRAIDDYQIWMTQNLDLDLSTNTVLNGNDTDLRSCGNGIYSSGYTMNGGICYWTPGESTKTNMDPTTSNTTPQSYNPGAVYYYQNQSASTTCTTANECLHWHVGNYYNWTAAIASNDSSNQIADYVYAGNSICPAGWRLPIALTSSSGYSDFNYLLVQQGIAINYVGVSANATWTANGYTDIQSAQLYIVRSGYNNGGTLTNDAIGGSLWTGSSMSNLHAYDVRYDPGSIYPAIISNRFTRLTMRCVARD